MLPKLLMPDMEKLSLSKYIWFSSLLLRSSLLQKLNTARAGSCFSIPLGQHFLSSHLAHLHPSENSPVSVGKENNSPIWSWIVLCVQLTDTFKDTEICLHFPLFGLCILLSSAQEVQGPQRHFWINSALGFEDVILLRPGNSMVN